MILALTDFDATKYAKEHVDNLRRPPTSIFKNAYVHIQNEGGKPGTPKTFRIHRGWCRVEVLLSRVNDYFN